MNSTLKEKDKQIAELASEQKYKDRVRSEHEQEKLRATHLMGYLSSNQTVERKVALEIIKSQFANAASYLRDEYAVFLPLLANLSENETSIELKLEFQAFATLLRAHLKLHNAPQVSAGNNEEPEAVTPTLPNVPKIDERPLEDAPIDDSQRNISDILESSPEIDIEYYQNSQSSVANDLREVLDCDRNGVSGRPVYIDKPSLEKTKSIGKSEGSVLLYYHEGQREKAKELILRLKRAKIVDVKSEFINDSSQITRKAANLFTLILSSAPKKIPEDQAKCKY
jgi:hypothetical protein